jgi:hypothetical protein
LNATTWLSKFREFSPGETNCARYLENVGESATADEDKDSSDEDELISIDEEETASDDELTGLSASEYATSEDEFTSELDETSEGAGTTLALGTLSSEHAQNNEAIKDAVIEIRPS